MGVNVWFCVPERDFKNNIDKSVCIGDFGTILFIFFKFLRRRTSCPKFFF